MELAGTHSAQQVAGIYHPAIFFLLQSPEIPSRLCSHNGQCWFSAFRERSTYSFVKVKAASLDGLQTKLHAQGATFSHVMFRFWSRGGPGAAELEETKTLTRLNLFNVTAVPWNP